MFNIIYAFAGLLFGLTASYFAKKKNRRAENWFLIGFIFNIFGVILILSIDPAED